MKLQALRLLFFAGLFVLAAAWTKEDYEIFRLNDEVAASEGANVTFYDFLGVRRNANYEELTKAHRQKTKLLHPDKVKRAFIANSSKDKSKAKSKNGVHVNKGPSKREIDAAVKAANERSSLLNNVAKVLRSPARERYDHFLKNGFPKWKGTGYYYSRFRPGLGSVLIGLFLVFGGGAHYAALVLSWRRQRDFVERYIRQARKAAWGDEMGVPGFDSSSAPAPAPVPAPTPEEGEAVAMPMNRRQKRMMERENRKESKRPASKSTPRGSGTATPTTEIEQQVQLVEPTGPRKRVVAENGKVLIVDSVGNVFLEEETEEGRKEFLLDVEEIHKPTLRDTMVFRLPIWAYEKTVGKVLGTSESSEINAEEELVEVEQTEETSASAVSSNGPRRRGKRSQRS